MNFNIKKNEIILNIELRKFNVLPFFNEAPEDLIVFLELFIQDETVELTEDYRNQIKLYVDKMGDEWTDSLRDYLDTLLKEYKFSFTSHSAIEKIVKTFILLNRQGIELSTFDLICAKFSNIELRRLIELSGEEEMSGYSLRQSKIVDIKNIIDRLDIRNKYNEINSHYLSLFTQTIAIYYHLNIKNDCINNLNSDVIKSEYIFKIDNNLFTDEDINYIINIFNSILLFLNLNCAVRKISKISNYLSLIPIISNVIDKNINLIEDVHKLTIIRKNYFHKLLYGYYDKDQSQMCIQDSIKLHKLLNNDTLAITEFNQELEKILHNDFLNKKKLTHENLNPSDAPKESAVSSILSFIESFTDYGNYIDFKSNKVIIDYDTEIQIHHIVPIGDVTHSCVRKKNEHLVNSVLNKTVISKEANRGLSDMKIERYLNEILNNVQVCGLLRTGHLLPADLTSGTYKVDYIRANLTSGMEFTQSEKNLLMLYNLRFNLLLDKIQSCLSLLQ